MTQRRPKEKKASIRSIFCSSCYTLALKKLIKLWLKLLFFVCTFPFLTSWTNGLCCLVQLINIANSIILQSIKGNPQHVSVVSGREKVLSEQQANSFLVGACPEKYSQASVDKRAWSAWNHNTLWVWGEGGWAVRAAEAGEPVTLYTLYLNAAHLSKHSAFFQVCSLKSALCVSPSSRSLRGSSCSTRTTPQHLHRYLYVSLHISFPPNGWCGGAFNDPKHCYKMSTLDFFFLFFFLRALLLSAPNTRLTTGTSNKGCVWLRSSSHNQTARRKKQTRLLGSSPAAYLASEGPLLIGNGITKDSGVTGGGQ